METIESQNQILEGVRRGDSIAVKKLYEEAYRYCASFVLKNSGTQEDARETFQESLFVLVKKLRTDNFDIQHSLKAYLYRINQNLWLNQLRKDKKSGLKLVVDEPDNKMVIPDVDNLEEKKQLEDRHQSLYQCMKNMEEKCRKMIQYTFYQKLSDKEIAPLMEYSLDFTRQKRRRCIKGLKKCMVAN